MEAEYSKDRHYVCEETIKSLQFRHSHWEDDGELHHILQIYIEGGKSKATSSMHFYPSPDELRRLSAMFAEAADGMEAHAASIKARDEAKAGEAA